jgi:hypothetical protein
MKRCAHADSDAPHLFRPGRDRIAGGDPGEGRAASPDSWRGPLTPTLSPEDGEEGEERDAVIE